MNISDVSDLIRDLDENDRLRVWTSAYEYHLGYVSLDAAFEQAYSDVADHLHAEDHNSSNIQEAHYNRKTGTVDIVYRSGGTYMYPSSDEEFQGLRSTANVGSVGKYVNKVYKNGRFYWEK